MPFYRKRPVIIEAIQYTGDNVEELKTWGAPVAVINGELVVQTLEDGVMGQVSHVASIGDYIIKGVRDEFYPCKPDIFNRTHESVSVTDVPTKPDRPKTITVVDGFNPDEIADV